MKENVIRVTSKEKRIIELLRECSLEVIERELVLALTKTDYRDRDKFRNIEKLARMVRTNEVLNLKDLRRELISEENIKYIFNDVIKEQKNLLITGKNGTGKTSLITAIMIEDSPIIKDTEFIVYDEYGEYENLKDMGNIKLFKKVDLNSLADINLSKRTYLVIDEFNTKEKFILAMTAIGLGFNIIIISLLGFDNIDFYKFIRGSVSDEAIKNFSDLVTKQFKIEMTNNSGQQVRSYWIK